MDCKVSKILHRIVLHNVLYSSKLRRNLLAGHRFEQNSATFIDKNGSVRIISISGKVFMIARKFNELYN